MIGAVHVPRTRMAHRDDAPIPVHGAPRLCDRRGGIRNHL